MFITKVFGKDLDEKTFDAMMKVADVDGDGEVDFDEFKAIMRASPVSSLTTGLEAEAEPETNDVDSDDESEVSSEESAFDIVQEAQATAERSMLLARTRGLPRPSFEVMDYAPVTQQKRPTQWGKALAAVKEVVEKKEIDTSQCHEHMQLERRRRSSVLLLQALEHIKSPVPVQEPSPPSVIPVVKKPVDPERVRRKEVDKAMAERRRKLEEQKEAIVRLRKDMPPEAVISFRSETASKIKVIAKFKGFKQAQRRSKEAARRSKEEQIHRGRKSKEVE